MKRKKAGEKRKYRAVTYPGIVGHAAELGVGRVHLWMVLTGRRVSRSLTARYNALTGK